MEYKPTLCAEVVTGLANPINLESAVCTEDLAKSFVQRANPGDVEGGRFV
jgi:hypothetical protein